MLEWPTMPKQTVKDVDVAGKRVLVRVDFNVPLSGGKVADDTRIRQALPTIKYLLKEKARIILLSHLGRPKGEIREELRLDPVAQRLEKLLKVKIHKVNDCVGQAVNTAVSELKEGEILLLENTRFHIEETENNPAFAAELASYGDVFVQEAFGVIHRDHASVTGVAKLLPSVSGLLMKKEIDILGELFLKPKKPLVLVVGGAKIDTKIGVIRQFLSLADTILLGGGLANTFLAAEGYDIGESFHEPDKVEIAQEILMEAEAQGNRIILPTDAVCADADIKPADNTPAIDLKIDSILLNLKIYDIGLETSKKFVEIIESAGTVIWNGPVGYFEKKPFSAGTRVIAEACASSKAVTLLGGGDTIKALSQFEIPVDKFTHVSTGGGAMLEFLEGKKLPGLEVLRKR